MVYKVDLENAYDHVDWRYLEACLLDFGFNRIIVKLVMHCVTSSSLSILWNGKHLPSFLPTRGLRQGDPLPPYLFVICTEKLSLAISEAATGKKWLPI